MPQKRSFSYPTPYAGAFDRVSKYVSKYVAFWKEVQVTELTSPVRFWRSLKGGDLASVR